MPNWFNRPLKMPSVKHSVFDLSNDYKTSMRIGYLTPVGVEEILPSDKLLKHSQETFIRFAPLKFPVMHRIKVHMSNFFVPFRIVLGEDLYEQFLNNKVDIVPVIFKKVATSSEDIVNPFRNSILDYLGIDVNNAYVNNEGDPFWEIIVHNPLAFFGYLAIVRDWYCDSNIQSDYMTVIDSLIDDYRAKVAAGVSSMEINLSTDEFDDVSLFNIAYTKDYFNTARPQPQLGSQMYVLNRPLNFTGVSNIGSYVYPPDGTGKVGVSDGMFKDESDVNHFVTISANSFNDAQFSEGTTIRDLWKKEMMQRYLEVDNTFGSRIREKLAGHFGVRYSDQRIQIPMYCGGSSSYAQISEVLSHSDTADATLGQYAGKAVVADRSSNRQEYFEEHGYYISLLSLIPDNGYCNGQQRTFEKRNIFDFASPEFNNVGWQDIYNSEVYVAKGSDLGYDHYGTWGYQPRYSEYRSHPSRCTGNFRGVQEELAYHLNRNFDSIPPLNEDFLKVADTDRIFSSEDISGNFAPLYVDVYHKLLMSRPIAYEPDSMHLY